MFSTLVSVALFFTLATRSVYAAFTIDTPTLVQCEKVKVTWSKTEGPYDLVVAPTSDPCEKVLVDLGGNHQSTSLTWLVNIPAGTQAMFSLLDANGDEAWSGAMTVKASNDSSCLTASPSGSAAVSVSGKASSVAGGSTLVVPPSSQSASSPQSSNSAAVPVGAANAGLNPTGNGAPSLRQLSVPIMALSTFAAIFLSVL
ncbi:hypothetical protein NLI96_g9001 [Meripilus lineatus]|uniref:Uncharacterized protein n=1 Tax=Meripilus lineatus TaxID=2056292 RepID=A0AAD5YAN9_9APHY|nr:hypothetical protein NLI96_g9001 [Physisporinus lineatus]